jgi:hypothetical protein
VGRATVAEEFEPEPAADEEVPEDDDAEDDDAEDVVPAVEQPVSAARERAQIARPKAAERV